MRKTKIIATIGPSCCDAKIFKQLVVAGLNVARINLSHSTRENMTIILDMVKKVREELNKDIAVMIDTKGPEIRTGVVLGGQVPLKKGNIITFTPDIIDGDTSKVSIVPKEIFNDINVNSKFTACNGLIGFKCIEKVGGNLICKILNNGVLGSHKSMSFPNIKLSINYLNKDDEDNIVWAIKNNIEYVAASFVSNKEDIISIKNIIDKYNSNMKIIAKIENKIGVENLDEILEYCDGAMVARGDLGIEVPLEKVPKIQKMIIQKCHEKGKIVITATEMLESMTTSIRPTRAETSDVANAVYDGTSAVMLSGETAVGKYPEIAIETMAKIASQTEKSIDYRDSFFRAKYNSTLIPDVMSIACVQASFMLKDVKAIVVYTDSGHTAQFISRFRPNVPIVALTPSKATYYQMAMVWGVEPILVNGIGRADDLIEVVNRTLKEHKIAKVNDVILIGSGSRRPTKTDMMKVHIIE